MDVINCNPLIINSILSYCNFETLLNCFGLNFVIDSEIRNVIYKNNYSFEEFSDFVEKIVVVANNTRFVEYNEKAFLKALDKFLITVLNYADSELYQIETKYDISVEVKHLQLLNYFCRKSTRNVYEFVLRDLTFLQFSKIGFMMEKDVLALYEDSVMNKLLVKNQERCIFENFYYSFNCCEYWFLDRIVKEFSSTSLQKIFSIVMSYAMEHCYTGNDAYIPLKVAIACYFSRTQTLRDEFKNQNDKVCDAMAELQDSIAELQDNLGKNDYSGIFYCGDDIEHIIYITRLCTSRCKLLRDFYTKIIRIPFEAGVFQWFEGKIFPNMDILFQRQILTHIMRFIGLDITYSSG